MDVLIDASTGQITSRMEEGKLRQDHLDLPADVSNGLPPNLLMSVLPSTPETKLSFVAPTDKPPLIHVSVKPAGEVRFTIGGAKRKAVDFVLHVELGGITGVVAPMVGKQPPTITFGFFQVPHLHSFAKRVRFMKVARSGGLNKSAPNSCNKRPPVVTVRLYEPIAAGCRFVPGHLGGTEGDSAVLEAS